MPAHRSTLALLKALFLATVLCFVVAAQNNQAPVQQPKPSKDQDALRIETELVQIDAVVTDKQGKLIHDLKREDFELFEDGKKQTITHFAVGTAKQPARWLATDKKRPANSQPTETAAAAAEQAGRFIVLAVDDYHLSPGSLGSVKQALTKFISEQMVPGDQIAIVCTSGNVGLFQQFTRERDVLERAINRLTVQTKIAADNTGGPRISEHLAELVEFGDREAIQLAINEIIRVEGNPAADSGGESRPGNSRQGGRGGQSGGGQSSGGQSSGSSPAEIQREMLLARAKSYARMVLAHNANFTRATLDTLESVIRSLRPLNGRKLLVLLSDGFYLGAAGINSQIYNVRQITDAATRAGVVIYSVDARGLVAIPPGGDITQPSVIDQNLPGAQVRIEQSAINAQRDGIGILAEETGGSLYFNNNDLSLGLQRVLNANETYYVLAYEPTESRRNGQFHKIELRIAGRSELKAKTRNGYFSPDEKQITAEKKAEEKRQEKLKGLPAEKLAQELKAEKDKQMVTAIGSLFPLKDIPVEMAVDFMDVPALSGAAINIHIDAANLSFEPAKGRQQTIIDIKGFLFDERGKVASSFNERINLNVKPENLNQIIKHGFNYRRLAGLQPGFYQTRVAIREESSGRLGSAMNWIEVPDVKNKQLMLSGILLSEGGQEAFQGLGNASEQSQSANSSTIPSGSYSPQPSSASRRFKVGSDMDFLFFVYNGKIERNAVDLVSQTQLFSGSKLVYASPLTKLQIAPDLDLQRVPYGARFSLKGFAPGQYELRLMVIDRLAKATAYRRVNFTVE